MKTGLLLFFLCAAIGGFSQTDSLLIKQSVLFHQKLMQNDKMLTNYLDENLSYGHSNGWVESKTDMLANLNSGKTKYNGIREDSMSSAVDKEFGWVRFVADMNVMLDGKQLILRLKVLEIWIKKTGGWKLYARQAVRA